MSVEFTEALLIKAAGWEVMKRARAYLSQGQVLSSYWAPPLLRGVVQSGEMSFRASMVIHSDIDIENLCTCRDAREWGTICAHSVGVGLHWLRAQQPAEAPSPAKPAPGSRPAAPPRKVSSIERAPTGEAAELHIILPPNFGDAIARGKLMLVLEARWAGGRCPLNALPKGRPYSFGSADTLLLDRFETLANGETPGLLQLPVNEFSSLLPLLAGHPNVTLGKSAPLKVSKTPVTLPLLATLQPTGEIVIQLKGRPKPMVILGDWVWQGDSLQPLGLSPSLGEVQRGAVTIARERVPQFLSQEWPRLERGGGIEANFQLADFTLEPQAPRFILELNGGLAQLAGVLQCRYGKRVMTLGVTASAEDVWLPDPEVPTRYSTRDHGAEQAAVERLRLAGFSRPDDRGKIQLLGQNAVLSFFAREYPKLEREWTVTLEERLARSTQTNIERIEPRFKVVSSGVQWFDLGVVFSTPSGETFSPAEIQRLLLSGQTHTRLRNGRTALLDTEAVDELQQVLRDCSPEQHSQGYRISNNQAGFLETTLREHRRWQLDAPAAWTQRAARQSGEAKLECPPLGDLDAVLRPYQKYGVAWLRFLRENGFGGILADEMGLGKTLQALAFLRWVRQGLPTTPPMLVVCPTSLVFNWVAEANRFTPELKVLPLHGPDRHGLFDQLNVSDLIITSYALLRRDAERYRNVEFDTVVLDEAQHIKNRQTQNAQTVKAVRARMRLVLTGTPLENSVADLWSIFDFLMPGYLGTAQDFRERYEMPISRERDSKAQARLSRRLRPFLLRRLKQEVATDLPPKLEQVAWCELSGPQREVYQQLIDSTRKEVLAAVGQRGFAKSRMMVLQALLRLRQVCCDLRLLKLDAIDPATASGKLDIFGELLEEVLDGGHRVLVFSQFVSMLSLLKDRLDQEGLNFCYLDGSTIDRGSVVQRFQGDATIPVFLISLKAGGVGLNLTGADTVIHFDPWWNPAVEDQATDRAHRIGQNKVITSYKLIARDTIEEKILTLQNRKREIIRATLRGEEEFASSLNWEEIQELLS